MGGALNFFEHDKRNLVEEEVSPRLGAGAQLSPVEEENGHRVFFF